MIPKTTKSFSYSGAGGAFARQRRMWSRALCSHVYSSLQLTMFRRSFCLSDQLVLVLIDGSLLLQIQLALSKVRISVSILCIWVHHRPASPRVYTQNSFGYLRIPALESFRSTGSRSLSEVIDEQAGLLTREALLRWRSVLPPWPVKEKSASSVNLMLQAVSLHGLGPRICCKPVSPLCIPEQPYFMGFGPSPLACWPRLDISKLYANTLTRSSNYHIIVSLLALAPATYQKTNFLLWPPILRVTVHVTGRSSVSGVSPS
ncbi:unnamed protein product [Arabis nemorensis]|uniref:Uncharacterized protein n=1 Tax=Arabis nemorensis TaxID=586526 RepID=A0A565CBI6_9BRAS|nr:unnamed protein product [Arabis nemorensis]